MQLSDYVEFRSNPANDHITDGVWCNELLKIEDLVKWKLGHPKEMFSILEKRRAQYADHLIKVDQALFEKAKNGDPRAVELVWQRFEGWSAKIDEQNQKQQGIGKSKTLADLMKEID